MRESPKTEKMHLGDAYEEWLKRQSPPRRGSRHQKPPADAYEAWVEKRVEKRLARPQAERNRPQANAAESDNRWAPPPPEAVNPI